MGVSVQKEHHALFSCYGEHIPELLKGRKREGEEISFLDFLLFNLFSDPVDHFNVAYDMAGQCCNGKCNDFDGNKDNSEIYEVQGEKVKERERTRVKQKSRTLRNSAGSERASPSRVQSEWGWR
ncbi:hypothetical protein SRHO_G00051030 [Serrasalmus rhombeus]